MRIAFVDNVQVGGGLSRFSYKLCKSLLDLDPAVHVDYYVHDVNLKRTPELTELSSRITIHVLETTISEPPPISRPTIYRRGINKIARHLKKPFAAQKYQNDTIQEIEARITNCDVAYFPVAHMMKKPQLKVPMVGTIHDFNWKYFFGRQIFSTPFVEEMEIQIIDWLQTTVTACSSYDVVNETKKLYPHIVNLPHVVHIGPVIFSNHIEEVKAEQVLADLHINFPYLLFPGNFFPHKNHLNLFTAFSILRQNEKYKDLKLILTGLNTDQIQFGIAEKIGVRLVNNATSSEHYDVRGLGYQPNHVIDALIKKAKLLVSPSIYEAICTPGMDAWNFGTPTAISDIPPFREHETVLGIRSAFFNPTSPENIASTLDAYLTNYETAIQEGAISKQNIAKYGWDKVGEGYVQLFKKAIKNRA